MQFKKSYLMLSIALLLILSSCEAKEKLVQNTKASWAKITDFVSGCWNKIARKNQSQELTEEESLAYLEKSLQELDNNLNSELIEEFSDEPESSVNVLTEEEN